MQSYGVMSCSTSQPTIVIGEVLRRRAGDFAQVMTSSALANLLKVKEDNL